MKHLLLLAIVLPVGLCMAQPLWKETVLKQTDGLPSNNVLQTATDERGFLIVATAKGLCRYDGYKFFNFDSAQHAIQSLFVRQRTAYYFDHEKGLYAIRNLYDTPQVIAQINYTGPDNNNRNFENIYTDTDGRIWCSDYEQIKYFATGRPQLGQFVIDKGSKDAYKPVVFLEPIKNEVWAACATGLYVWQKNANKVERYADTRINGLAYTAAFQISTDSLLFATAAGGIFAYNIHTNLSTPLSFLPGKKAVFSIKTIQVWGQKKLVLATQNDVYECDLALQNPRLIYSSKNALINSVQVDAAASKIWVSTAKGLVKLSLAATAITQWQVPGSNANAGGTIPHIQQAADGSIWLANGYNGVWNLSSQNVWKQYRFPGNWAHSICITDNEVLVSTYEGLFAIQQGKVSELVLPGLVAKGGLNKCMVDNKRNLLWVLPTYGPVQVYQWPSLQKLGWDIKNDTAFWNENEWHDMLLDSTGKCWLAGWMPKGFGVAMFDSLAHQFVPLATLPANLPNKNFMGDYFNRIALAPNGGLYFSGAGGWNSFNLEGKMTGHFFSADYGINDQTYGMAEDRLGNIWLATNDGLCVYNTRKNSVVTINDIDGLPSNELIEGFCLLNNGNLAIGCGNLLTIIDTKAILQTALVERFEISNIKINGKTRAFNSTQTDLYPTETDLSINFSALTFSEKEKVQYRYRLKEKDAWISLGNTPELLLQHLEPGNYQLEIEAGDNLGNWQQKTLRVNLRIHPSFFKTGWFVLLCILVASIILYGLYRNRIYNLRLKNDLEKERLEKAAITATFQLKLADTELSALRSQMNPHFIFNCLNSIKLYAEQNNGDAASEYLTKFSRLIRLVLDNSLSQRISLASELEALDLYLQMEAMRFKEKLQYSINIAPGIDTSYTEIPPLLLQPYVENAIWHGLMNKKTGGDISVDLSQKSGSNLLLVTITDNGVGRQRAAELKSKSATINKSFGIQATADRIALVNQLFNSHTTARITDLTDEAGQPCGTKVEIEIPL